MFYLFFFGINSSAGSPKRSIYNESFPPWGLSKCSSLNDFLLPTAASLSKKKQKRNASVDLVPSRRGDLLMGDLEIMEMFLLEPQECGGDMGEWMQVTQRVLLTCSEQRSSQVHAGRWFLKRTPLLPRGWRGKKGLQGETSWTASETPPGELRLLVPACIVSERNKVADVRLDTHPPAPPSHKLRLHALKTIFHASWGQNFFAVRAALNANVPPLLSICLGKQEVDAAEGFWFAAAGNPPLPWQRWSVSWWAKCAGGLKWTCEWKGH